MGPGMYRSLDELAQTLTSIWSKGKAEVKLVKAKLIVDYKLDGGTEDGN